MLLAALVLALVVVWPLGLELGVGVVLGYVSERPVAWALRKIHRESSERWRWAAASLFATLVLLVLLLPAAFALWVALRELSRFVTTARLDALGDVSGTAGVWLDERLGRVGVQLPMDDLRARAQGLAATSGAWLARQTGHAIGAAPGALFSGIVVLTAWVTFTVRGRALRDAVLPVLIPWPRERELLRHTTAEVIDSVVLANVGVSFIQAAIVTIATVAVRIPNALVWGVASFVLSFVPLVGTALVTLGAAAWLFMRGRTGAAVAMLVVSVIAGSVDNVLRPLLARGSTELPFLWFMVAFVGGVTAFGVSGVILGPLVLVWTVALWHEFRGTPPPPTEPSTDR